MFNMRNNVDYTTRDYEGFRNDMIDLLKAKIPEYSDFSQSDMGVVLVELLAHGLDVLSFYNDKVANEIFPDTAMERESVIKHCRRLGYELKNAVPSRYNQVFKIHPQPRDYVIPRGLKILTSNDEAIEFELIEDLFIPKGCNGLEKDEQGNYLYSALVEHGSSINSDIIGSSNGSPYQDFILSYSPVIIDSIKVFVRDSYTIEEWKKADNFIDSDITSKQFMVETTENDYAKIMFGSGVSGAIPPIYENGISASYRIGGGEIGNVSLETITELPSKPAVIIDTFNYAQVQIGKDKETIEEAKLHAPMSLKTLWRAVCLYDYENLLYNEFAGEITSCKAIAEEDRFTVSLYVLTNDKTNDLPEESKKTFLDFLDERKEIGYNLQMFPPVYSDVTIDLVLTTTKANSNSYVKQIATAYLDNRFTRESMKFGEPLMKSLLTKDLMSLQGVIDVSINTTGVLEPKAHEIVRVKNINIEVVGGV